MFQPYFGHLQALASQLLKSRWMHVKYFLTDYKIHFNAYTSCFYIIILVPEEGQNMRETSS